MRPCGSWVGSPPGRRPRRRPGRSRCAHRRGGRWRSRPRRARAARQAGRACRRSCSGSPSPAALRRRGAMWGSGSVIWRSFRGWGCVGVDVAAAAQQRGERGEHRQSGGDAEHDHQAVVERPPRSASGRTPCRSGPAGARRAARAARRSAPSRCAHRVHAEHRREQRRHRRQAGDLVGDRVRHALLLQAGEQLRRQAASRARRSSARRTRRSTAPCRSSGTSSASRTRRRAGGRARCS